MLFVIFTYWKNRHTCTHLLIHLPNAHNNQGWAISKRAIQHSMFFSNMADGDPNHLSHHLSVAFQQAHYQETGSETEKLGLEPGSPTQSVGILASVPNAHLTVLCLKFKFRACSHTVRGGGKEQGGPSHTPDT